MFTIIIDMTVMQIHKATRFTYSTPQTMAIFLNVIWFLLSCKWIHTKKTKTSYAFILNAKCHEVKTLRHHNITRQPRHLHHTSMLCRYKSTFISHTPAAFKLNRKWRKVWLLLWVLRGGKQSGEERTEEEERGSKVTGRTCADVCRRKCWFIVAVVDLDL